MKKNKLLPSLFLFSALILSTVLLGFSHTFAMTNLTRQGFDVEPSSPSDFSSSTFKQSLQNLKNTNANYVTLIIPYYQNSSQSPQMGPASNTPSDSSLAAAITYAHSIGLKVTLRVHLSAGDQAWRANINTPDRTTWFANYGSMLNHFGQIAQANGAEEFCLGQELIDMTSSQVNSTNTSNWINMIKSFRTVFSGKVTYGANSNSSYGSWYDEKDNIDFWPYLDYLGMSAYPTLSWNYNASQQDLTSGWDQFKNQVVAPTYQKYNMPITFTELGFRSITTAYMNPWDYNRNDPYDGNAQANAYQSFFSYWNGSNILNGTFIWDWKSDPNAGGSGNTDYTVQNKPAQAIVTTGFSGSSTTPASNPTFTTNATSTGSSINQPVNITSNVTDTADAVSNVLVDVEVYNSQNQRVFQQVFTNQNFTNNQKISYNSTFNTSTQNQYKIKIGVFSSDWSKNYNWNDNAGAFTLGTSTTVTPSPTPSPTPAPTSTPSPTPSPIPTSYTVNVWWPSNGSTVTGVQPFKARIDNLDLSQYTMYWQVDNGSLNLMSNNSTDAPHKESLVDLTNWTWNSTGKYTVNFVAKNTSGQVIASNSVVINVTH